MKKAQTHFERQYFCYIDKVFAAAGRLGRMGRKFLSFEEHDVSIKQLIHATRGVQKLTAVGLLAAFAAVGCGGGGGGGDSKPPTSEPGGSGPSTGGGDLEWEVPLADHFIAGMVDGVNKHGTYHIKAENEEDARHTGWIYSYNLESQPGGVDRRYLAAIGQGLAANSSLTVQWDIVFNQRIESDRIGPNNPYRCGGGIAINLVDANLDNPQSPFYSTDSQLGGNCEIIFTSVNENNITGTFTGVLAPRDSSQKSKTVSQGAFSLRNATFVSNGQEGTVTIASNFSTNGGEFTADSGMPIITPGFVNSPIDHTNLPPKTISPEIQILQLPSNAVSYAVIMENANKGNDLGQNVVGCSATPCVHWSVFNIPRSKTMIGEGENLSGIAGVVPGVTYTGPKPRYVRIPLTPPRVVAWDQRPEPETVTYLSDYNITVYALNGNVPSSAKDMNRSQFESNFRSQIVGRKVWNGVYEFDVVEALRAGEYVCEPYPIEVDGDGKQVPTPPRDRTCENYRPAN